MRTADFKTGAPLKTYEIRSAKDQRITDAPGGPLDVGQYHAGERIEFVKTDDINAAMKGAKFEFEAKEIGNTTEPARVKRFLTVNKNDVRNNLGSVICEILPSQVDGSYAGNHLQVIREMVDLWNKKEQYGPAAYLSLIPMRMMAEIAQDAYNSYNWHGRPEYRTLADEAAKLAKEWDASFELKYEAAQ